MAMRHSKASNKPTINETHQSTSIGASYNSKPKNKHKKRQQGKKYRGQGR